MKKIRIVLGLALGLLSLGHSARVYQIDRAQRSGALRDPVIAAGAFTGKNIAFSSWTGFGGNLAEFQNSALSAGHFNPLVDVDGVSRRVPLLAEYDGKYYEAPSLAMVRVSLRQPPAISGYAESGILSSRGYSGLEWLDPRPGTARCLGSRLESITEQYGVGIIVSDAPRALVHGVVYRELDRVRVKGKDQPVGIFEPLGVAEHLNRDVHDELRLWNQALRLYRQQLGARRAATLQLFVAHQSALHTLSRVCKAHRVLS